MLLNKISKEIMQKINIYRNIKVYSCMSYRLVRLITLFFISLMRRKYFSKITFCTKNVLTFLIHTLCLQLMLTTKVTAQNKQSRSNEPGTRTSDWD